MAVSPGMRLLRTATSNAHPASTRPPIRITAAPAPREEPEAGEVARMISHLHVRDRPAARPPWTTKTTCLLLMDYRRPRRFDGSTLAPDLGMSSRKHAVRRTCPRLIPILLVPAPAPGIEHSRSLEKGLLQREARSSPNPAFASAPGPLPGQLHVRRYRVRDSARKGATALTNPRLTRGTARRIPRQARPRLASLNASASAGRAGICAFGDHWRSGGTSHHGHQNTDDRWFLSV